MKRIAFPTLVAVVGGKLVFATLGCKASLQGRVVDVADIRNGVSHTTVKVLRTEGNVTLAEQTADGHGVFAVRNLPVTSVQVYYSKNFWVEKPTVVQYALERGPNDLGLVKLVQQYPDNVPMYAEKLADAIYANSGRNVQLSGREWTRIQRLPLSPGLKVRVTRKLYELVPDREKGKLRRLPDFSDLLKVRLDDVDGYSGAFRRAVKGQGEIPDLSEVDRALGEQLRKDIVRTELDMADLNPAQRRAFLGRLKSRRRPTPIRRP